MLFMRMVLFGGKLPIKIDFPVPKELMESIREIKVTSVEYLFFERGLEGKLVTPQGLNPNFIGESEIINFEKIGG